MYEKLVAEETVSLSGLIIIETDDLLGGGIGPKFQHAIEELQKMFKFGSWHYLKDRPRQYGGRTLFQLPDKGITIDMNRYLKDRAHEIKLERGRKPEDKATPSEITAGRGLMGSLNWATREGMPQGCGDCSIRTQDSRLLITTPMIIIISEGKTLEIPMANAFHRLLVRKAAPSSAQL